MDREEVRRRLVNGRVGRLATVTDEGRPHVVPCCFAVSGDALYTAVDDIKPKSTFALRRLDNLAHRTSASLLVDHYEDDWTRLWWVRVDGEAQVVEGDERDRGLDLLATKYRQYAERRPPGPVIVLRIRQWRGWTAGALG